MSLLCGNCRKDIKGKFGLIYLIDKTDNGFVYPDNQKDIVPPNSAICSKCWELYPKASRALGEVAQKAAEATQKSFYVYTPDTIAGEKDGYASWSSIVTDDTNLTFLDSAWIEANYPKLLKIIKSNKQEKDKTMLRSGHWFIRISLSR